MLNGIFMGGSENQINLSTSSLTLPSFQSDPAIFNRVLFPHLGTTKKNKCALRELYFSIPFMLSFMRAQTLNDPG